MNDLDRRGLLTENASLRARIDALERKLSHEVSPAEADAMAAAQARADATLSVYGERVSAPKFGESSLQYQRRALETVAKHSPKMRGQSFYGLNESGLAEMERIAREDALLAARAAAESRPGTLVAQQSRDESGRLITKFYGDIGSWMQTFQSGAQICRVRRDPPPG